MVEQQVGSQDATSAPAHTQGQVDEKTWALLAHISSLSGILTGAVGAIVGPLLVWLIGREKHPFIDRHGKEALNFGITVLVVMAGLGLLVFLLMVPMMLFAPVGMAMMVLLMPLMLLLVAGWIVFAVIAAVKASNGEEYRYPVSIRFVK